MPRVCFTSGVQKHDPCPKKTLLQNLKRTLDQLDSTRTCPPIVPRLHITSETCKCDKKDPNAGKLVSEYPLWTLDGQTAQSGIKFRETVPDWNPPRIIINKIQHPDMCCYGSTEPKIRQCSDCDCRFGFHLHNKQKSSNECCYIECEFDKAGFRDWKPKHSCNYPNYCKAACFDTFNTSDYVDFDPEFEIKS